MEFESEVEVKAPKRPSVECEVEVEVEVPKRPSVECEVEVEVEAPAMPPVECEVEVKATHHGYDLLKDDELTVELFLNVYDAADEDKTEFLARCIPPSLLYVFILLHCVQEGYVAGS